MIAHGTSDNTFNRSPLKKTAQSKPYLKAIHMKAEKNIVTHYKKCLEWFYTSTAQTFHSKLKVSSAQTQ